MTPRFLATHDTSTSLNQRLSLGKMVFWWTLSLCEPLQFLSHLRPVYFLLSMLWCREDRVPGSGWQNLGLPHKDWNFLTSLYWWQPTAICLVDMTYTILALLLLSWLYHYVHAGLELKLGGKAYQTPRKSQVQGQLPDVDQLRLECRSEFWWEQCLWNGISGRQTD